MGSVNKNSEQEQGLEKRLFDLQSKIQKLEKDRDQAVWKRDQVLQELQSTYGLATVEEAEAEVKRLTEEAAALEEDLLKQIGEIEVNFKDLLALAEVKS